MTALKDRTDGLLMNCKLRKLDLVMTVVAIARCGIYSNDEGWGGSLFGCARRTAVLFLPRFGQSDVT